LPSSTFDWQARDGLHDIPIEERDPDEVHYIAGELEGRQQKIRVSPKSSSAANPAFDVTPARLVTGLITERGICKADEDDIMSLFPEFR
jgi:methylthioribose-1-phosphate isomerase